MSLRTRLPDEPFVYLRASGCLRETAVSGRLPLVGLPADDHAEVVGLAGVEHFVALQGLGGGEAVGDEGGGSEARRNGRWR